MIARKATISGWDPLLCYHAAFKLSVFSSAGSSRQRFRSSRRSDASRRKQLNPSSSASSSLKLGWMPLGVVWVRGRAMPTFLLLHKLCHWKGTVRTGTFNIQGMNGGCILFDFVSVLSWPVKQFPRFSVRTLFLNDPCFRTQGTIRAWLAGKAKGGGVRWLIFLLLSQVRFLRRWDNLGGVL